MSTHITQLEIQIAQQRKELDTWLDKVYTGREHLRYSGEIDCAYPHWHVIEDLVRPIFDRQLVTRLCPESIDSLLFFISRNEEYNSLIVWLSTRTDAPLSGCGSLAYADFIFLCEQALVRDDDFCDYQLAASFEKFQHLDETDVRILSGFFDKHNSYTRRRALHALARFARPETVEFARRLWETDDCEFAKLSCLHSLKRIPEAQDLFHSYLVEFENTHDTQNVDYLRSHMAQLRSSENT